MSEDRPRLQHKVSQETFDFIMNEARERGFYKMEGRYIDILIEELRRLREEKKK